MPLQEASLNPSANRERLTQIRFQTFNCLTGTGLSKPFVPGTRHTCRVLSDPRDSVPDAVAIYKGWRYLTRFPLERSPAKLSGVLMEISTEHGYPVTSCSDKISTGLTGSHSRL